MMKRVLTAILLFLFVFVFLPSVPGIRAFLAAPLVIHDENASGEACYVLAAGNALWERLSAASDLFHMHRVRQIILMNKPDRGPYSFRVRTSWTQTQWAVDYLRWRGVPRESIRIIDEAKGSFGTLIEARSVAGALPANVKQLVLVTSAPHTRRAGLIFRRVLPQKVSLISFAASSMKTSSELHHPLWLEYFKLAFYAVFLYR